MINRFPRIFHVRVSPEQFAHTKEKGGSDFVRKLLAADLAAHQIAMARDAKNAGRRTHRQRRDAIRNPKRRTRA